MGEREAKQQKSQRWLSWAVLLALLLVALIMRWRDIREFNLFVDEFVTAWAGRNILSRGLPILPCGNIYPHGFVFTYLAVPFVLRDLSEPVARLPGLIVSLPMDTPPGDFSLLVGMYCRPTNERLQAVDASGTPLAMSGVSGQEP